MSPNILAQTNDLILTYIPARYLRDISIFVTTTVITANMPESFRRSARITTGLCCFAIVINCWLIPGLCLALGGWLLAVEFPAALNRKYPQGKTSNAYIWDYVKRAIILACVSLCYFTRTGFFLAIIAQIFGVFIPDAIVRKREWQADKLLKTTEDMNNSRLKVEATRKMFARVDAVEFPNKPKALAKMDRWLGILGTGAAGVFLAGIMLTLLYGSGTLGYTAAKAWMFQRSEQTWPSTQATIISDELRSSTSREGRVTWSSYWTYSYEVDGTPYVAKSIDVPTGYDAKWFDERGSAVSDGLSRPPGSQTTTYYDPAAPRRSVLDKRTAYGGDQVVLGIAVAMLALAGLFGFLTGVVLKAAQAQWRSVPS